MRRLLVAAGAVAAITVAGCGTTAAPSLGNAKLSAAEVLQQTAQKADDVNTYSADLVVDFSSPKGGGAGNVQGTMLYQKTPQLASDITLNQVTFGGQSLPGGVRVVLQGDVAYVKLDVLKTLVGATKPWIKLDLKQLGSSSGVNVDQLLGQAQQIDLKTSVALLTASKDAKAVGAEKVGGVDTTHYTGTFDTEQAVKLLAPEAQARLQGGLSGVKDVKFDAWIDAQGLPRKVALNGGKAEEGTFKATALFKAFNEPVTIQTPPADQVGEIPKNISLGG
ncbi:LppX_LprAFG lipoprotein [Planotetraspora sp. A-T 1434]|uniref:LppX_LprAFG lipoprotein n=1 Tax=Planotetraspora sp. A-T 1434 TaxID=2979219 RepID=UPI0021BF0C6B|nr:LppX_LprAFG lipoprotein [Planotetraspora sp. A-T 1434]MCT9934981.1 LppX_LprAFG lipoprotein [Planotetraspora sp. A-T 1434]